MEIIIRADENKWLTDGEHYGKTMSLAKDTDIEKYYEITDTQYQEVLDKLEKEAI